jgi:hypothetical protein
VDDNTYYTGGSGEDGIIMNFYVHQCPLEAPADNNVYKSINATQFSLFARATIFMSKAPINQQSSGEKL